MNRFSVYKRLLPAVPPNTTALLCGWVGPVSGKLILGRSGHVPALGACVVHEG